MRNSKFVRSLSLLLAVLMAVGGFIIVPDTSLTAKAADSEISSSEMSEILNAESYQTYKDRFSSQPVGPEEIVVDLYNYTLTGLLDGGTVDYAVYLQAKASPSLFPDYTFNFENDKVYSLTNVADNDESRNGLFTPDNGKVTWTVNIPADIGNGVSAAGRYAIVIEYFPIDVAKNVATVERTLSIDNSIPFAEARSLSFAKNWVYGYEDENGKAIHAYRTEGKTLFSGEKCDFFYDRDKGLNDLRYTAYQVPIWKTYSCSDVNGFYHETFEFYFSAGTHTISLEGVRENLVIGSIKLVPLDPVPSYEDYLAANKNKVDNAAGSGTLTMIQAEFPTAVSDTSVYPSNDRSSAITQPSSPASQWLNTIGASSYSTVGQWASYKFTVSKSGWYDLTMRYRQNTLEGLFVSRVIKLAGGQYGLADGTPTLPFKEATRARFDYDKNWKVAPLGDGETPFKFYFEEGVEYTLYLEVGLGDLSSIIETVQNSLSVINTCYLDIIKLTGTSPDKYADYKFMEIMPDTIRNLLKQASTLYGVSERFVELCGTKGAQVATLDQVAYLLDKMGNNEDEIAKNLSNLKSYIGTLGTWLNTCKTQSLLVDYVSVQPVDASEPRENANFFQAAWFEIRAFFSSFFVDYNSMGVKEEVDAEESIAVWLAYGRDESLIWRNLIDTEFTPASNIAVQLKLVAAGTLLPSVLAGQGPDVYIGLGAADVINYAIRGAIKEVQNYPGYVQTYGYDIALTEKGENDYTRKYYISEDSIKKSNACTSTSDPNYINPNSYYVNDPYHPELTYTDENGQTKTKYEVKQSEVIFNYANTIPISLYGKTYGVPETTNFPMMFYRMDVLEDLGMEIPKTWDDLLAAIPVLQSNNMEVGLAYLSALTLFLYQMGGSQWLYEDNEEYAGAAIGLGTNIALDAFSFCCRLYTDYRFPVSFDAANRFRTGEMPLVITDYCTMYNTLTVFATEIRGLWSFTSIPGMKNDNGTINNCSVATLTATVMLYNDDGREEAAWKYMMWQAGGDAQASYGNQMVALVGPAAKYATANVKALQNLSWTSSEIKSLMAQFENLAAIPNYPGSYIISRYVQFAFLAAYNDRADPVDEMYSYITTINKELTRKREEFDLKTLEIGEEPPGYENGVFVGTPSN